MHKFQPDNCACLRQLERYKHIKIIKKYSRTVSIKKRFRYLFLSKILTLAISPLNQSQHVYLSKDSIVSNVVVLQFGRLFEPQGELSCCSFDEYIKEYQHNIYAFSSFTQNSHKFSKQYSNPFFEIKLFKKKKYFYLRISDRESTQIHGQIGRKIQLVNEDVCKYPPHVYDIFY